MLDTVSMHVFILCKQAVHALTNLCVINSAVTEDAMLTQEMLWEETISDDLATESDARQGGTICTEIDPIMMHDIQAIVGRLVAKAGQLIGNFTTNLAEGWMQIRSKFDGGKVINRSQSGSWEHRCHGAALQQNLGRSWGPPTWAKMTSSPANQVFIDTANSIAKKVENTRKRKATETAKEGRRQSKYSKTDDTVAARKAYSRHDNGILPDEYTDDISAESLEELKSAFYSTQVELTQEKADIIEQETREQSASDLWIKERSKRITASRVGSIAKMRKTTRRSKKVEELLYSRFKGNRATLYGSSKEDTTRQQYITYQQQNGHFGLETQQSGLVISCDNHWLAASPDDRVNDPSSVQSQGVAEYKNPFAAKDLTLEEACDKCKTFCLERRRQNGKQTFKLKKRHNYYFQVQCQMYRCDVNWCDFVLRTNKELHVERINRDQAWWNEQLSKLKVFYFESLLPELSSPRYGKGGIREPATTSEK